MEKEVVYKPVIDTAALAEQLASVQAQLNVAMGANAFNSATPVNQPFMGSFGELPSISQVTNFSNRMSMQTSNAFSFAADATTGINAQLMQASQALQMGAYKFNNSLQLQGLMQPIESFVSPSVGISNIQSTSFEDAGFFGAGLGMFRIGYDPNTEGQTRYEFQMDAEERMRSAGMRADLAGFGAGMLVSPLTGAAAGAAIGGVPGAVIGFGVSVATDLTIGASYRWLARNSIEQERLGAFAQEGSFRFTGGKFSDVEASNIGKELQQFFWSREMRDLELNQTQAEGLVSAFTSAGGFDTVTSAEQYTKRVKEMIRSVQTVSQLLSTTLEEATNVMAGVMNAGLAGSPGEALGFISKVDALSTTAGMTSSELLNVSMAGANMMQGTGIGFGAGANAIISAATGLRRGMAAGTVDPNVVMHAGGLQQAAASAVQLGTDFGTSPIGMIYNAAGGLGNDIYSSMALATQNVRTPQDILNMVGSQADFVTQQGPMAMLLQKAALMNQMAGLMNVDITSPTAFRAFATMGHFAADANQADIMYSTLAGLDPRADFRETLLASRQLAYGNRPGILAGPIGFMRDLAQRGSDLYHAASINLIGSRSSATLGISADVLDVSDREIEMAASSYQNYLYGREDTGKRFSRWINSRDSYIEDSMPGWLEGRFDDAAHTLKYENISEMMIGLSSMTPEQRNRLAWRKIDPSVRRDIESMLNEAPDKTDGLNNVQRYAAINRGSKALGFYRGAGTQIAHDLSGSKEVLAAYMAGEGDPMNTGLVIAGDRLRIAGESGDVQRIRNSLSAFFSAASSASMDEVSSYLQGIAGEGGTPNNYWLNAITAARETSDPVLKQRVLTQLLQDSQAGVSAREIGYAGDATLSAGDSALLTLMRRTEVTDFLDQLRIIAHDLKQQSLINKPGTGVSYNFNNVQG